MVSKGKVDLSPSNTLKIKFLIRFIATENLKLRVGFSLINLCKFSTETRTKRNYHSEFYLFIRLLKKSPF